MTADELQILLNLRAQLSEYEVFMTQLSTMIARGMDIPCIGTMAFPMREKLYGQVRDLVIGKSAMAAEPKAPKFKRGDLVKDKITGQTYRVFATDMVALQDTEADVDSVPSQTLHEDMLDLYLRPDDRK